MSPARYFWAWVDRHLVEEDIWFERILGLIMLGLMILAAFGVLALIGSLAAGLLGWMV